MSKTEFFDPHFHIWDVNEDSKSAHSITTLFAPNGNKIYGAVEYEKDCTTAESKTNGSTTIEHVGGVWVEAMSVHYTDTPGSKLQEMCLIEAKWCSAQLATSEKNYVLVPSACLEAPNARDTLQELCQDPLIRGVRQIVNYEPNWPRNGNLGNLLEKKEWIEGFKLLEEFNLSFNLQLNPHQYHQAAEIIKHQPKITIIINHLGCPTLEDLTDDNKAKIFWDGMQELAACKHTYIKLSMLCYTDKKWDTNSVVVDAVHRIISLFGADRCFFASNYPVDLVDGWTADRLFSGFLKIADQYDNDTKNKLFSINAQKAYKVTR